MKLELSEVRVWTAMVTPFVAGGERVDYDSFRGLLKSQEAAGNGVLIFGTTGEGLSLSLEERKEIVAYVVGLELKVPLLVGVSGVNFKESLAWVEWCKGYAIDAFILMGPTYTKPGIEGQCEWFKGLMDVAERPCFLYNNPSRSGVEIFPGVLANLKDNANLWGIKESSGLLETYYKYKKAAPALRIYCGEDYLLPFVLPFEVKGLVSVVSNIWPEAVAGIVREATSSRVMPVDPMLWWECSQALYVASNPIPTKSLLHDLGKIEDPGVRTPLSVADLKCVDALKRARVLAQELESLV